ncbi:MAG: heparan-alpha-glucosaminide N-acetyltransferase domain-containing protein [Gemmatimonadaceae bacterium]|nr:heparan-alpha-glucosaminide N-acetyltransferase domain-containing protein [Gemmatimonadaceae bacterium]
MTAATTPVPTTASGSARLSAIDALRGLVIVLMVIDHAREYSVSPVRISDPMDLAVTPPLLFWMRWVTHFCAPVFTVLAGVSAGLQAVDRHDRAPWSWHHITRGLVLVLLEVTVIHLAWTFSVVWPMHYLQVIWGIGVSLIVLGLLQRVPVRARALLGLLLVAGHNTLDGWHPTAPPVLHWIWAVLHDRQVLTLWGDWTVRTSYPVLPMIGLVLVGDAAGRWYRIATPDARVRALWRAGLLAIACFVLLRAANVYGDLHAATYGDGWLGNAQAALNTTKYPMSLAFVLMTLGPAMLLLARWERARPRWTAPLVELGRVPMFLYITHLYLLHAGALLWALLRGVSWSALDFRATITGLPVGFGFAPWVALPVTAATLLLLYPAARGYARLRASKRYWITRYL